MRPLPPAACHSSSIEVGPACDCQPSSETGKVCSGPSLGAVHVAHAGPSRAGSAHRTVPTLRASVESAVAAEHLEGVMSATMVVTPIRDLCPMFDGLICRQVP